jgi:hypothetical protein
MSIDAMKQALEALEGWANHGQWVWPETALEQCKRNTVEAIPALHLAIEQAERQESYWQEEARRYAGNADFWREKAKRQPLTDEEIEAVWKVAMFEDNGRHALLDNQPFVHFARAIERAHGIGGEHD